MESLSCQQFIDIADDLVKYFRVAVDLLDELRIEMLLEEGHCLGKQFIADLLVVGLLTQEVELLEHDEKLRSRAEHEPAAVVDLGKELSETVGVGKRAAQVTQGLLLHVLEVLVLDHVLDEDFAGPAVILLLRLRLMLEENGEILPEEGFLHVLLVLVLVEQLFVQVYKLRVAAKSIVGVLGKLIDRR